MKKKHGVIKFILGLIVVIAISFTALYFLHPFLNSPMPGLNLPDEVADKIFYVAGCVFLLVGFFCWSYYLRPGFPFNDYDQPGTEAQQICSIIGIISFLIVFAIMSVTIL